MVLHAPLCLRAGFRVAGDRVRAFHTMFPGTGCPGVEGVTGDSSNEIVFSAAGQHTVALVKHGTSLGDACNTLGASNSITTDAMQSVRLNVASDYSAAFY